MAAAAAALHQGNGSSSIAGFVAEQAPGAWSSIHKFHRLCGMTKNAGVMSRSHDASFHRSQIFGGVLHSTVRISSQSRRRSVVIQSSSAVGNRRRNSVKMLCSAPSSHGMLCNVTNQPLPSRWRSLSSFRNGSFRKRGGQTSGPEIKCLGNSATGVLTFKPFLDQIILLGTVFSLYIAGIASVPRLPQNFMEKGDVDATPPCKSVRKTPAKKQPIPSASSSDHIAGDELIHLESKLSRAMLNNPTASEVKREVKSPVLGLQAIARLPRLHLLLTTLQHLRKEVETISDADQYVDIIQWQDLSLTVLSRLIQPICKDWLFQDFWTMDGPTDVARRQVAFPKRGKPYVSKQEPVLKVMTGNVQSDFQRPGSEASDTIEMNVLKSMLENLKESEFIASYIRRSGKVGLYGDLLFFLRFKRSRLRSSCDPRVLKNHAGSVLEDILVTVAEVVTTLFLDCSSLECLSPHGEIWQAFLLPSILSSRSLERFRNQVALNGWLNQNFSSVAAMFEDRFDLWTVQALTIPSKKGSQRSVSSGAGNTKTGAMSGDLVLTRSQLPAGRSAELKALRGWRYFYSLFLELSDVVGPLLSILLSKFGEGLSFLLVTLIGRSLGLVYQGIRQSIRWPSNQKKRRLQGTS